MTRITRVPRQISPVLTALAGGSAAAGIVSGYYSYLRRSPVHHAPVPGASAWTPHLIEAAVLGMLYGIALWRRSRGSGPGSARLLLLAPLGRSAAARLSATLAAAAGASTRAVRPAAGSRLRRWMLGGPVDALIGLLRAGPVNGRSRRT